MNGSVQPRTVVNFPGTGSGGHVRIHASPVPVLRPNVNGATFREMTTVEGTGKLVSYLSQPQKPQKDRKGLHILGFRFGG